MCWLRGWVQVLLPIFLSLFLIQLLMDFSEDSLYKIPRQRNLQTSSSLSNVCASNKDCQKCTGTRKCFWCSDEKACAKFCFPYSECRIASMFWLSCRVDMFGILMIVLIILVVILFILYCCLYHHYLRKYVHFILKIISMLKEEDVAFLIIMTLFLASVLSYLMGYYNSLQSLSFVTLGSQENIRRIGNFKDISSRERSNFLHRVPSGF